MIQTVSERLGGLPEYLFAELDRKRRELTAKGADIIGLGAGDPDIPPPRRMIEALKDALDEPAVHRYPSYTGAESFRSAVSCWLKKYHDVSVAAEEEILTLIGSKEGLAHLPLAVLNAGDTIVVTDPCYPVHMQAMLLAGARPISIPLEEGLCFLPDLSRVPAKIWESAKMVVINYPNNPTTAVATRGFFTELVALAHRHGFIICHDAAYIDVRLVGGKQPALLSIPGAKDVSIEFFTFSKLFNVCGWRIGVCAGNREVIASLAKLKTAVDSCQFTAIQKAVEVGLNECLEEQKKTFAVYRERRQIICSGLDGMGLSYFKSGHTFYIWAKVPEKTSSREYAGFLLEKLGIVVAPGIGFGKGGEGFIRISLTAPTERIREAAERMKGLY